jgi:hypothetical protein
MTDQIPSDLLKLKIRLDAWRKKRKYLRQPIPVELRRAVLELCSRYHRVRGWHCCHRPPLRTHRAIFTAVGSSISNALFGGRGAAIDLLLRLYDSPLQTTHVAISLLPFVGTLVNGLTQARASSALRRGFKFSTNSCFLRHRQRVS